MELQNETRLGLGVDMVKPWNSERINLVLGLRGTDIRPGLDKRHLIIEDHRSLKGDKRSEKVMEGHGRSRKVLNSLYPSLD